MRKGYIFFNDSENLINKCKNPFTIEASCLVTIRVQSKEYIKMRKKTNAQAGLIEYNFKGYNSIN